MIESHHPFQVDVLTGLISSSSKSVVVSAGKVYNFYNPLNFRKVLFNRGGVVLPALPLPMSNTQFNNENIKIDQISLTLVTGVYRVAVYLLASFNAPTSWVPGRFYIPMVDSSWLVFLLYKSDGSFEIRDETKNPSLDNIKNETFDINDFEIGAEYFFETDIKWKGNPANLGLIALLDRKLDGEWKIEQFIKENFPITALFNSNTFEMANTKRYNTNVREGDTDQEKLDKRILFANLFNEDGLHFYRGYVPYRQYTNSPKLRFQHKLPFILPQEALEGGLPLRENIL